MITANAWKTYTNESGSVVDLSTYHVDEVYDAYAVPLLILADISDLVGARTIALGAPANSYGDLYYSTGIISFTSGDIYTTSNDVASGMSGSGLIVNIDTNGDALYENYVVGTLATASYGGTPVDGINPDNTYQNANYTAFTPFIYQQLADDMASLGVNSDDLPTYTLISGFDEFSSSHEVHGTFLNEKIIGGAWHDLLDGGDGDDTYTGGAGADSFWFFDQDGDDVVKDLTIGEDSLNLTNLTQRDFQYVMTEGGVLLSYNGEHDSILFEGLTIEDLVDELPVGEYYMGFDYRGRWDDIQGDSIVYVGEYGGMVYAGIFVGNDHIDATLSTNSKLTYRNSIDRVIVDFRDMTVDKGDRGVDTWEGSWNHIAGSEFDDIFYGTEAAETIWTWSGDDEVYTGGGDDRIILDGGSKTVDGGDGYDSVTLKVGNSDIYIFAEGDARQTSDMSVFTNVEYIDAFNGNQNIHIGAGTDVEELNAGSGNDTIINEADYLSVIGGSEADVFDFSPINSGANQTKMIIQDFVIGTDHLFINGVEVDILTGGTIETPSDIQISESAEGNLMFEFGDDDFVLLDNISASEYLLNA